MEQKMSLMDELTQGKELAIQLRTHLNPSSCSSQEATACVLLSEEIHSSFEKALSLLNWANPKPKAPPRINHNHVSKKRKVLPRWTEEVKVCSGTADAYSWRKYGQKDIHRAAFPRCYYRCTHRNVQGCLATKQVQQSDNDPTIFEVTYRGRHTCTQSSHPETKSVSIVSPNESTKQNLLKRNPPQEIPFDFGENLNPPNSIKTEDLDDLFPSFCFPSSSIGSEIADETLFYDPTMMESTFIGGGHGGRSDVVLSPETSESNYFRTCDWSGGGGGGGVQMVHSSDQSDLTEIISAPTSVTNSPIGAWDFSLENVEFDPNFPFDNLELFS